MDIKTTTSESLCSIFQAQERALTCAPPINNDITDIYSDITPTSSETPRKYFLHSLWILDSTPHSELYFLTRPPASGKAGHTISTVSNHSINCNHFMQHEEGSPWVSNKALQ